jgi:metal-responsive CopG/Arc/MetJ family transcriptional regulator
MEKKQERVPVMFDKTMAENVDDYMFANRIRGRSEAIRRLVRAGLEHVDRSVERARASAE